MASFMHMNIENINVLHMTYLCMLKGIILEWNASSLPLIDIASIEHDKCDSYVFVWFLERLR